MIFGILAAILAVLIYLPSFWVRCVMSHYGDDRREIPGTGGELALHLINRFQLEGITVVETDPMRDHFYPSVPAVRLGPENFHGKSLTAVAVATHEVGHAIQFHRREAVFRLRSKYLPLAAGLNRSGIALMWTLPLIGFFLRTPFAIVLVVGLSLLLQLAGAMAYLIILPEEWDASFNKALPILIEGEYVEKQNIPAVKRILKAAALTYFAAALANVLNIGRWLLLLRR